MQKRSNAPQQDLMSTRGEGGSGSSSHAKGRKDKEIMREDPIEEESSHESESEEEPVLKKKKREPKPPKKKKPPPTEIAKLFKAMEFKPTVYPDPHMLKCLGLYDVFLEKLGLERLLTLQRLGYQTATYHFLSSLTATFYEKGEDPDDGHGFISFKIGRQTYRMSFKRISEVMGFPDRHTTMVEAVKGDTSRFWSMIAAWIHDTKHNKGADIRNPSIRYVQRILSSTLFARKDPGRVVEDELKCLIIGLKNGIGERYQDNELVHGGSRDPKPGIVGIFVKRLQHYQEWAWTKRDKGPQLSIGGLITPLLEAMDVPLGEADVGYELMDESFLTNTGFLDGIIGNSWVYCYKTGKAPDVFARTFLPNQEITSTASRDSIIFHPPQEAMYNPDVHEIPKKISKNKKKKAADDSQQEESADQGPSHPTYGSSRYYFPPYSGALPDGPLREAHMQIRTLQRGNKFQDRTIAKLVKSVNYLAKKLKSLTLRLRRSRASTPVTTDDPMDDEDGTAVGDVPVHAHRHSYHGDASATEVYYKEPRASLRETRQRRPQRQRHSVPALPPNDSGNETPYIPTSDTDDPLGKWRLLRDRKLVSLLRPENFAGSRRRQEKAVA
ncbi:hypothetical protein Bca4012_024002 [Brassica carinata]